MSPLKILVVLLGLSFGALAWTPLPEPFTEHCIVGEKNEYDPSKAKDVKWFDIDLDAPAYHRWDAVANEYKDQMRALINVIKNLTYPLFQGKLIQWVDKNMGSWDKRLKQPYQDELKGISNVSGLNLGEVVLYNAFYEINAVCTSIVAQDNNNKLYHARNLDFGLFLGWNPKTHDWALTEKLRSMIINVRWMKGGKVLYKSNNFAGYVGIYNAVKQGVFTLTANERYAVAGGYIGLINWLLGVGDANWMTWATRQAMEQATSYDQAINMLSTVELMSPAYFIVGGTSSGQGSVISRGLKNVVARVNMNMSDPNGWYVLETNYDPNSTVFWLDDRRVPGNMCMQKMGRSQAGFQGIYNVLSSKTNYNKLTVYTVLMNVESGALETYIRKCPDPCWPW
jgi:acid ceramidase